MKNFIKGLLISLIPIIIFTIGILIVSNAKAPGVKYLPEIVKPGYQTEPAKYIVEASFAKCWRDSRKPFLIVIAYFLTVFGTAFLVNLINQKQLDKAGNYIIGAVWLISSLLIFIPMSYTYGSSSYESTLTVQEYENNKNNLDNLFPYTERK